MKRKPLILAFALLLVIGAALIGVNYRLNNPPLTDADREFRALVSGADRVEFIEWSPLPVSPASMAYFRPLNATQARQLIEHIQLLPLSSSKKVPHRNAYGLTFYRGEQELARFRIGQTPPHLSPSVTTIAGLTQHNYILNPRFQKSLQLHLRELKKIPVSKAMS